MDYWMVLSLIVSWLGFVYFIEKIRQRREDEGTRRNLGIPIDKLEDGVVYYQYPLPIGLIFLSKDKEVALKAYILDGVDIKKLPNSFMFLQDGEKIVPWDPVYLYDTIDDIINDLAGKYPV